MVRIDLHVHTRRYSSCAETLDPRQLPSIMVGAGLQGVVVTEHDAMWTEIELGETQRSLGAGQRIYRGVEVTTSDGHYLVIGLSGPKGLRSGMDPRALVAIAQRERAAIILAHPYRSGRPSDRVVPGVNALELYSPGASPSQIRALAHSLGIPVVAGSDAHADVTVGAAFTCFPRLPRDERDLATLIVAGAGIAGRRNEQC